MSISAVAPDAQVARASLPTWLQPQNWRIAAQEGALFAWTPIVLIIGIWSYFAVDEEPSLFLVFLLVPVIAVLALIWTRNRNRHVVIALALLLAGFCLGKLRTEWVRAPVLPATTGKVVCEGEVEGIQMRRGDRQSLTIRLVSLTGVAAHNQPDRVRLNAAATPIIAIGDHIRSDCTLMPPPAPAAPGGYDYARTLWFEGIGATGRALGQVSVIGHSYSTQNLLAAYLQKARTAIGDRIRSQLSGDIAAIGDALITGERAEISQQTNTSLQISGLAHVLSISGLHMSLIAGGVFALVRGVLALSPTLALSFPIKKWAALAALLVGFFYMLLSGGAVATQRSYVMLAIMFLAILLDRPALSTRNLAIAALLILFLEPESALSASFQMSFLAVAGLVCFYDAWFSRAQERQQTPDLDTGWRRWLTRIWRALLIASATTLIAGTLSSIPALYHFGRASPFSLLANLLATPVIGLVVMPMALASVLLIPLGLDALPLQLMGEGLRLMLAISEWVAGLPGARMLVPTMALSAVLLLALAALMLCLLRGPSRWAGLVLLPVALLCTGFRSEPDILIERTASNVAIRTETGQLAFANTKRGRFAAEKWLQANGEEPRLASSSSGSNWTCAKAVCSSMVKDQRVVYLDDAVAIASGCPPADILIARFPLRDKCDGRLLTVDRFDVWRNGAYSLYLDQPGITQRTSRSEQGRRPWTLAPVPRRDLDRERPDAVQ